MWGFEFLILLALCGGHVLIHAAPFGKLAASAAAKVSEPPCPGAEVDELGTHVQRRLRKKRHEAWLDICKFLMHLAGVGATWAVANVVLYGKTRGYVRGHIVYYILISLTVAMFRYLPGPKSLCGRRLCWDRCDIAYAAVMSYTTFTGMTGGCYMDIQMGLVRMAFSAVHRSSRQTAAWNLFYTVCVFFRAPIAKAIAFILASESLYVEKCYDWIELDTIWDSLFSLCMVIGVTVIFEELAKSEAAGTVLAQSRSNEHKALTSILNATSDAVVRLDAELNVVGPSQKLAAMLLHGDASLDGVSFASLLVPGSAHLPWIREKTSEASDDSLFATRIQTEMKDLTGCPIAVMGFHTQFTELDGRIGHLLGLSEVVDPAEPRTVEPLASERGPRNDPTLREACERRRARLAELQEALLKGQAAEEAGVVSTAPSGSFTCAEHGSCSEDSDGSSMSSSGSERTKLVDGDGDASLPAVWLDTDGNFGMVRCTRSFLLICGPNLHLGAPLLDWAGQDSDIAAEVRDFRALQAGHQAADDFSYETSVSMYPKHLGQNYMVVSRASMVMDSLNVDDTLGTGSAGCQSVIRVTFSDVNFRVKAENDITWSSGTEDRAASAQQAPAATEPVTEPAATSNSSWDSVVSL